jgi:hypothetical protein
MLGIRYLADEIGGRGSLETLRSVSGLEVLGLRSTEHVCRIFLIPKFLSRATHKHIYTVFTALSLLRSQIYTIQTTFVYDSFPAFMKPTNASKIFRFSSPVKSYAKVISTSYISLLQILGRKTFRIVCDIVSGGSNFFNATEFWIEMPK